MRYRIIVSPIQENVEKMVVFLLYPNGFDTASMSMKRSVPTRPDYNLISSVHESGIFDHFLFHVRVPCVWGIEGGGNSIVA
jgi:hypothetical protein